MLEPFTLAFIMKMPDKEREKYLTLLRVLWEKRNSYKQPSTPSKKKKKDTPCRILPFDECLSFLCRLDLASLPKEDVVRESFEASPVFSLPFNIQPSIPLITSNPSTSNPSTSTPSTSTSTPLTPSTCNPDKLRKLNVSNESPFLSGECRQVLRSDFPQVLTPQAYQSNHQQIPNKLISTKQKHKRQQSNSQDRFLEEEEQFEKEENFVVPKYNKLKKGKVTFTLLESPLQSTTQNTLHNTTQNSNSSLTTLPNLPKQKQNSSKLEPISLSQLAEQFYHLQTRHTSIHSNNNSNTSNNLNTSNVNTSNSNLSFQVQISPQLREVKIGEEWNLSEEMKGYLIETCPPSSISPSFSPLEVQKKLQLVSSSNLFLVERPSSSQLSKLAHPHLPPTPPNLLFQRLLFSFTVLSFHKIDSKLNQPTSACHLYTDNHLAQKSVEEGKKEEGKEENSNYSFHKVEFGVERGITCTCNIFANKLLSHCEHTLFVLKNVFGRKESDYFLHKNKLNAFELCTLLFESVPTPRETFQFAIRLQGISTLNNLKCVVCYKNLYEANQKRKNCASCGAKLHQNCEKILILSSPSHIHPSCLFCGAKLE